MDPARTTLVLGTTFVLLAFGWRSLQQYRRTGSTGFVALRERGAAAKVTGLAMVLGVVLLATGAAVADRTAWNALGAAGVVAMLGGLVFTLAAQRAMGGSWRVGVDPNERTELVITGLFGRVRNPIFTAMLLFAGGAVLAVPTAITALGLAALGAGIAGQVLLVEEPHLRRQHGAAYEAYVGRTGRFVPRRG